MTTAARHLQRARPRPPAPALRVPVLPATLPRPAAAPSIVAPRICAGRAAVNHWPGPARDAIRDSRFARQVTAVAVA